MLSERSKNTIRLILLVVIFFTLWYLGRFFQVDREAIEKSLLAIPMFYRGLIYIFLYVIVTFFIWFSKDLFWVIGALLFGAFLSAGLVWIAEIINACILFSLARSLGRSYVERLLKGRLDHLEQRLNRRGFFWFFIFRAVPTIPYRFLDLGAGLTSIPMRKYMAAVILGSFPKILWIQSVLYAAGNAIWSNPLVLADYFLKNKNLFIFSIIYLIVVGIVIFSLRGKK